MKPIIVAHRTCLNDAPENSLKGIRMAAELGADVVEVDVQLSSDGVPVLVHDRTLWRTAGVPLPASMLPIRVLHGLHLRGSDERVPSLEQALGALPGGLKIAIEIKRSPAMDATMAEVRNAGMEERTLIWANYDEDAKRAVRELPGTEVSLLRKARSRRDLRKFIDDAAEFGVQGISVDWRAVDERLMEEAHARELIVYSLSPHLESTFAHIKAGIDGVITDWPRELREALPALQPQR